MTRATPLIALALALAAGCTSDDSKYGYSGYDIPDHFPLEGERTWTYVNTAHPDWKMVVVKDGVNNDGDYEVVSLKYYQKFSGVEIENLGDDEHLFTIDWVSSDIYGVLIAGYEVFAEPSEAPEEGDSGLDDSGLDDSGEPGDTGSSEGASGPAEAVSYDPPIKFGETDMIKGESIETETGGTTFTSTFDDIIECENEWVGGDAAWECLYFVVDDGDGDSTTGAKVAGEFWIAPRYGASWFKLPGDDEKWILSKHEYEGE